MNILGLKTISHIDDIKFLGEMKNLIFLNDDTRPVWSGIGYAKTNIDAHMPYAKWANEHWALYFGFIHNISLNNKRMLDLGCGVGFNTINLCGIGDESKIIGYDIDKEIIDFSNKYNKNDDIIYINENIIDRKFQEGMDYVFLIETLEHIKHTHHYNLIDNCLNSLKDDNSRLFISTPNEQQFSNKERGHVGILTNKFFELFKKRYKQNIVSVEYYDNKKLVSHDVSEYTTTNHQHSHYKIIMKK